MEQKHVKIQKAICSIIHLETEQAYFTFSMGIAELNNDPVLSRKKPAVLIGTDQTDG